VTSACVILCSYRRPRALLDCLRGLAAQTRAPDEVILVLRAEDAESQAALAEAPHSLALRVAPVREPGLVAARNAGLDAARADILVFCDDDTVAAPHWLARVVAHFDRDARVGGVGGRDRCHDGVRFDERRRAQVGRLQWWGRAVGNHHLGFGAPRPVDFLKGANMSFRAAAIAGLRFDTRLRGKGAQPDEDFAFSLSVARAGWTLIYDPEAVVDHYAAADQIRAYVAKHGLDDAKSYAEACHNHALTIWGHLGFSNRIVFRVWAAAIGTSVYPGLVQTFRFFLQGDPAAWLKFRLNQAAIAEVVNLRGGIAGMKVFLLLFLQKKKNLLFLKKKKQKDFISSRIAP
jgi:GT2 family glycosyltransferase